MPTARPPLGPDYPSYRREIRPTGDFAAGRDDVRGLLLVGSRARGDARDDSDMDLVLLSTDPSRYIERDGWMAEIVGDARLVATRPWGAITERRLLIDGVEVDLGIGTPAWARTDPVDRGTERVVAAGARVLHDPDGALAALLEACA